jgi:hypothetical protein
MSDTALFQIMRMNVLNLAATEPGSKVEKAYVYAWARGVYPLLQENDLIDWQKPFANEFRISKQMVELLTKRLDADRRAQRVPTYYYLENVLRGRDGWDRPKLMAACRYICLSDWADDDFRSALLKDRPTEASRLAEPFDWQLDAFIA